MIISRSAPETEEAGTKLAGRLQAGDVVSLEGELGAGKTHFVKGMARALGFGGAVTSPTFSILHEYRGGRLPIFHFDFYRLESEAALREVGFDDYLFGDGVTVIEWGDRFPSALPPQLTRVRIQASAETREIVIV